eukprot:scaffold548_cov64-Phaeocystis_antarctica.AAC.4
MVWSSFRDHAVRGGCRFGSSCSADKEAPPRSLGLGPALASRFQRLRTASSERPGSRPAMARHFCPSSATPLPTGVGLGRGASAGARARAKARARGVWRVVCGVWCVAPEDLLVFEFGPALAHVRRGDGGRQWRRLRGGRA